MGKWASGQVGKQASGHVHRWKQFDRFGELVYNLANISNIRFLMMKNFRALALILSNLLLTLVIREEP